MFIALSVMFLPTPGFGLYVRPSSNQEAHTNCYPDHISSHTIYNSTTKHIITKQPTHTHIHTRQPPVAECAARTKRFSGAAAAATHSPGRPNTRDVEHINSHNPLPTLKETPAAPLFRGIPNMLYARCATDQGWFDFLISRVDGALAGSMRTHNVK